MSTFRTNKLMTIVVVVISSIIGSGLGAAIHKLVRAEAVEQNNPQLGNDVKRNSKSLTIITAGIVNAPPNGPFPKEQRVQVPCL